MKGKLLVVDDENITRQSLTDILKLEGYDVASVDNGIAAVDYVGENSVDLLVLDLRMPGMSGMEVVHALSQLSPDTEIILLTAHGSMETAVDALRSRVQDYLLKPASPSQIIASVERGLARRQAKLDQRNLGIEVPVDGNSDIYVFEDGSSLDLNRRIIVENGENTHLTVTEGRLLKVFMENQGRVFTFRELVLLIKGLDVSNKEAQDILRPLISRLKSKIKIHACLHDRINSVRGTGYIYGDQ